MGIRRLLLAPVAVAVLGLVGTACEPAPPPTPTPNPTPENEIYIHLDPSGTYEVLTGVVGLKVTVQCTRPVDANVSAKFYWGWGAFTQLTNTQGKSQTTLKCPGPMGVTSTTYWRWGSEAPRDGTSTSVQVGTYANPPWNMQYVTFTHILCWFGFSSPCATV